MNLQSKIIGFCYLYIVGIIMAMLAPVDAGWLPWLMLAVAVSLLPVGAIILMGMVTGGSSAGQRVSVSRTMWLWILLSCGALLLGYSRYTRANTVSDMHLGDIRIAGDTRAFYQQVALSDTSRLRLQKSSELSRDVRLRVVGELDARVALKSATGIALMDAQGRWKFHVNRLPLTSEIITIRADDPIGAGYVIDQPFTRIAGIEWLDGPDAGVISVHRISNHIGSFVRPGRAQSPVTVLGRITSDPRVYDFKTVLMITPDYIQYPAGGPFYRVEGGDIQVTIPTNMTGYTEFARTRAYGADVQIRGELTVARAESNPGGFNARKFMQNYNIYGLMNIYQARGMSAPMVMVAPEGGTPREGSPLVTFSLELRDELLRLFKATMPYPQSAFLGGVTLGLRYGLQGAQFPGEQVESSWLTRLGLGRSEALIVDDFRASGVNHVLAVSGLHVTIITAMFVAIFGLLRFPKQMFVPFVIFTLVVFAIITGARPSTLRAVIMNSLFLLTWAYLDKSLLSSVMIGVPVAAFIILLHNPLVVVDPSFTLSFCAILSLALITMPVHDILCHLRGNRLVAVILLSLATTIIGMFHWALIIAPAFLVPWLILCFVLYRLAGALENKGVGISSSFAFSAMPEPVSTFIAAQVAIQIGMMIPLSAYYFCRWPFGGAYANLLAIPLIGIVVQLGAIAGLLGLIPVVGPYIALVLSAANWLFTTFFLWLAHVCTIVFPYPFVKRPRVIEVVVYYIFIAAFIWHKPIWRGIKRWCENRQKGPRIYAALLRPQTVAIGLVLVATIPLWVAPSRDERPDGLHVTVLAVGYGSSILVESPGGKKVLIDTGFVEHERGRRNEADRTILPFLSSAGIRSLDGLILTSPLPERAAGAPYLLEQLRVKHLVVPASLQGLSMSWTPEYLAERLGGSLDRLMDVYHTLVKNPSWPRRASLAKALADRVDSPVNRWAGWVVTPHVAQPGTALFEEKHGDRIFRIEVLGAADMEWSEHPVENNSVVLRVVYGDFAMLLPGALHYEGQRRLASGQHDVQAQVMVAPHHGAAIPGRNDRPARAVVDDALAASTRSLLDRVQPEVVVTEFGSPRPVLGDRGRTAINILDITRQFYKERLGEEQLFSTDRDLAIMIHSDGVSYSIETQANRNRAHGGDDDAVSDLSVGL